MNHLAESLKLTKSTLEAKKGKRGRGAEGKSIVFGMMQKDGKAMTKVVEC